MTRQPLFPGAFIVFGAIACHANEVAAPPVAALPKPAAVSTAPVSVDTAADHPGLSLGDFSLGAEPVVDGDTIRVVGLPRTLRLLGVDAEETFKKEAERAAVNADWQAYLKAQRGESKHPVKMATPVGEEAKTFAKDFFKGVTRVRLERDQPQEIRDRYDRYLAYVFVERGGEWVNYNVELVRAGLSPYFMKYGYSRRFHQAFTAAQVEARAAGRGIWDPDKQHYPDYEERLAWWTSRAELVARFDADAEKGDGFVTLSREDALEALQARVGKEVAVLGVVAGLKETGGPTLVLLGRKKNADFPLVFFKKDVLENTGLAAPKDELVRAHGKPSVYHSKSRNTDELQLVIDDPAQITAVVR
jgi:endonuclease YncB( thermonuclease family)